MCFPAAAQDRLSDFLPKLTPAEIFPGADRFGPIDAKPPSAAVYSGETLLGYVYLNSDVVDATGYSGKPIHIVVGLALDGKIAGVKLVEHHEPIVLIGIPNEKVDAFIAGYVGLNFLDMPAGAQADPPVDIISGATVSLLVIGDSLMRSAIAVAHSRGIGTAPGATAGSTVATPSAVVRTIDAEKSELVDWETLLGDGSVRRLLLSVDDINAAFERTGNKAAIAHPESDSAGRPFIELYVAMVSVPTIGRSLLGDAGWKRLQERLGEDGHALIVAGGGTYSFKGSGYVRGGIFDRFEIIQGENSFRFRDIHHHRLGSLLAAGAPKLREIGLYEIPKEQAFNATEPWRLQLLVQRPTGGREKAFLSVELSYAIPSKYLKSAAPAEAQAPATPPLAASGAAVDVAPTGPTQVDGNATPLWQKIWRTKIIQIGVLMAALAVLTGVFFFQDWFVRRPVFYERFRICFLIFALFWIGWYAQAQLSVVNVLTFSNALRTDFHWEYFLLDPLIFILWFATAASLLFWNRGAFCGWLCPFGALQELTNKLARLVGIRQITVPFGLHQRLWVIKYIIFLGLFALSMYEVGMAERMSEVEPFKTAIILRFMRDWPYVAFALALLVINLFIERFFCRYLCPLGAALAIPARIRMFDWLKRYRECGSPCQRCANECPVQSIHPEGHINPNECIQCLHCQLLYHHDQKCPVMIQKRLKREKRQATSSPSFRIDAPVGAAPKP